MSTVKTRHQALVKLLKKAGGRLTVNDLSEALGVSAVTIRQDLRTLEGQQVLNRVYGGAVLRAVPPSPGELSFESRQQAAWYAKDAIGQFASQLVKDGYGIAMDGSTTTYALVPYLKRFTELTIITNSLIIAQHFRDSPRNQVLVPAGRMRRESATIVGSLAGLPEINLNYGFFGAWGISLPGGFTDIDPDEVVMRRIMMARCQETIVLADSRKWNETAAYTYALPEKVNRIITDENAPESLVRAYQQLGVRVDRVALP